MKSKLLLIGTFAGLSLSLFAQWTGTTTTAVTTRTGKVGIGTISNPLLPLHIQSTNSAVGIRIENKTSISGPGDVWFANDLFSVSGGFEMRISSCPAFACPTEAPLSSETYMKFYQSGIYAKKFYDFENEFYYLDPNNTATSLKVAGSVNAKEYRDVNNNLLKMWSTTGSNIYYSDGNVGIGTSTFDVNGAYKLEVEGRAKFSQGVTARGQKLNGSMVSAINEADNVPADQDLIWACHGYSSSQPNNPGLIGLTQGPNIRFRVRNNGQTGINCDPGNASEMLTVNGSSKFLGNVSLLSSNSLNALEIKGGGQKPARRGISLTDDPDGAFNFYIHSWQTNAGFFFINNLNDEILMKITPAGKMEIKEVEVKSSITSSVINTNSIKSDTIRANQLTLDMPNAADYVFDPSYTLRSLDEVEEFVSTNKHLPGMPSAAEFKENGVNMAEMNNLLLEKVEELTLYMIELKKQNEAAVAKNNELAKRIEELEKK